MASFAPQIAGSPSAAPRRGGFSLVELLVVIGIIALLTAILTVGITSVRGKIADRSTKTRLEALDAMLAAYAQADAATGGAVGRQGAKRLPTVVQPLAGGDFYSTVDGQVVANAATFSVPAVAVPLAAPALTTDLTADPASARTQGVLATLLRLPTNQKAFDALPTESKTGPVEPAGSLLNLLTPTATTSPLAPPLLVDAFNHPILYVPPTGLTGMTYADGSTVTAGAPVGQARALVAADGASFWASAGPDGSFAAGDDNVYSKPVVRKTN